MSTIGPILHWQTCVMLPSKETWCATDSSPCIMEWIANCFEGLGHEIGTLSPTGAHTLPGIY